MGFFNIRKNKDVFKLAKSEAGDWVVKKGYNILYIGSKEKCERYLKHVSS